MQHSEKTSLLSAVEFAQHGLLKSDPLTLPLLVHSYSSMTYEAKEASVKETTDFVPAGNDSRPSADHPQQDLLLAGVKHFQSSSTKQSW